MTDSISLQDVSNQGTSTSSHNDSNKMVSSSEKTNEIYFSILYRRQEQEKEKDFTFKKFDIEPEKIYVKEIQDQKGAFFYEKVFKLKRKLKKKEESKKHVDTKNNEESKKKKRIQKRRPK